MNSLQQTQEHPQQMWPSTVDKQSSLPPPPAESSCSSDEDNNIMPVESEAAPPPHSEIQCLAQDTIRRISAEQAISDLASIVKELVDNALDAEATTIKIRLFEQGLGIIEVSDDGCGIPPSSRPYIATRHATSKIKSIDEIYSGTGLTMGFRGEALFSMACVSQQLVVATRTDSEELATKIVFGNDGLPLKDQNGKPEPQPQFPRKVGTTVAVIQPYGSLPARRADLTRRIQQERNKIFKLMEAYAVFNVGVCFQVLDIVDSGNGVSRESPRMATSASSETLEETVSILLGTKTLKTMQSVDISLDSILQRIYGENLYSWGIRGLISKEPSVVQTMQQQQQQQSSRGSGAMRMVQYYCINGRVVDLPKVTDRLRNLWKAFGGKKKPVVVLDLTLPNEAFDINLSPDKQTVLLTHEKELLGVIEEYVTKLWSSSTEATFAVSQVPATQSRGGEAEGDDDDDDEEEDPERQVMHKRRFAFVHDPSKAKMQHEMAERRISDEKKQEEHGVAEAGSFESGDKRKKRNETPLSGDSEHDDPTREQLRKRSRLSVDSEQDAHMPPAREGDAAENVDITTARSASIATSSPQPSDVERRQFLDVQAKFHKRSSSDEQENVVLQKSVEASSTDFVGRHSQTVSPDNEAEKQPQSESSASTSKVTYSQTTLTSLKQFAYKAPSVARTADEKSCSDHEKDQNHPKESVQQVSSQKGGSNMNVESSQSPSSPRSIRQSIPGPGRPTDPHSRQVSKELSPATRQSKPSTAAQDANKDEPEDETDQSDTNDDANAPPKQVVWGSFRSTEQVCASARRERMNMIQRKQQLDTVRRSLQASNSMNSQSQDDANPDDEVAKKVVFDDENDADGSNGFIRMSKETFRGGLQVIGQFNMGFILAKCARNHLWILDQHACDEKYNFEQLCKTTVIHGQPLILPLPLELNPSEEACVLDHMDIFEANGFRFSFDNDAPIRHRLSLTALPHSGAEDGRKAVQFGPSDVSALCSILSEGSSYDAGDGGTGTDGSGLYGNNAVRRHGSSMSQFGGGSQGKGDTADSILARLPKAIAMFASRACRKSIMIGTALSQREMESVLEKMAKVDMPWTCAHGRPTMRHVGNLLPILMQDERRAAEYIATPTITMTPLSQAEDS